MGDGSIGLGTIGPSRVEHSQQEGFRLQGEPECCYLAQLISIPGLICTFAYNSPEP